jgi:hypothetical protein
MTVYTLLGGAAVAYLILDVLYVIMLGWFHIMFWVTVVVTVPLLWVAMQACVAWFSGGGAGYRPVSSDESSTLI